MPRLWDRHLLNCAALAELIPDGRLVADVGSGAGLPGLVLAIARPDLRVVLIEPMARRTRFLEEVVADCGLRPAWRSVAPAPRRSSGLEADIVTSRAVAPTDRLAAWSLPLLRPGGTMLALKGRGALAELDAARAALQRLGVEHAEVVTVGQALDVAHHGAARRPRPGTGAARAAAAGTGPVGRAAGRGRSTGPSVLATT